MTTKLDRLKRIAEVEIFLSPDNPMHSIAKAAEIVTEPGDASKRWLRLTRVVDKLDPTTAGMTLDFLDLVLGLPKAE